MHTRIPLLWKLHVSALGILGSHGHPTSRLPRRLTTPLLLPHSSLLAGNDEIRHRDRNQTSLTSHPVFSVLHLSAERVFSSALFGKHPLYP
ncbi:hypothetical protein QBC39DRAFT_93858 [Podospora conica]|nr:hypothetical protein QBC39DRAFT_93858 [Schizothecium conicum]